MTIVPAYGTKLIHLGQTSADLRRILGPPTRRRKSSSLREYWVYSQLGFDAIVSRKTGRLLSLFFHQGCPFGDDLLLGSTESAIYSRLHKPTRRLEGFALADGEFVDSYIAYDTGVSFFLDAAGRTKTVCITAKKRKAKTTATRSKANASHRELPELIAALRIG